MKKQSDMEIRTTNDSYVGVVPGTDINDTMDAIVCALILEGWHVQPIHDALIGKAEAMVEEFNLKEGGKE